MKSKPASLLLLFLLGLVSVISLAIFFPRLEPGEKHPLPTYPPVQDYELITIRELKDSSPATGFFNVDGYVAKIFSCPPCPAGADCMPCMEENIVISEQAKTIEAYTSISQSEMIIFAQNPERFFTSGENYFFSIRVRDQRTTDEPINDIELIGFSR
jgi:hypothetical protein